MTDNGSPPFLTDKSVEAILQYEKDCLAFLMEMESYHSALEEDRQRLRVARELVGEVRELLKRYKP